MAETERTYRRFNRSQRLQHWVMTVSFTVLAITGLPQRYALADWAEWMIAAMGGIETVRIIHRASAVIFILVSLSVVLYLNSVKSRTPSALRLEGIRVLSSNTTNNARI